MSKYVIPSKIFLEMGGWRQPLLMVDRIDDFKYGENGFVKVTKHITYNEPYLLGHFPDDPIMRVIISEILVRPASISRSSPIFAISTTRHTARN